ncbi:SpoIID/LytB domain-containing protein [Halalkalibacterium ligniniphilum]|uniref:SpoIID/LytB domain-containing protein n=1 Tax=Halalkalibacterium ligniniphilum TaxID=1134413 RepID=UPI0003496BEC|nr:SpoIID/LytB domain-containing protein [Halalkalibacterium ligniniphilum]
MIKKVLFLLMLLPLMVIFTTGGQAFANNPAKYETPIRVSLVPSINFNVTTTGPYKLLNVDNNKEVSYSGELQFRHTPNQVTVRVNGRDFTSNRGFELIEQASSQEAYTTITSVQHSGSFGVRDYRGSLKIQPGSSRLTLINELDIEDYLLGVVPREMPASWHQEALKAQAIAARNFAYNRSRSGNPITGTTLDQVYGGKTGEHANSTSAVRATRGIYALANGRPIDAYFHSSSGGHTENSENVWLNPLSYIRAVPDPYDRHPQNRNNAWTNVASRSDVERAVFGSGIQLVDLRVTSRTAANSVQRVEATGINRSTGQIVTTTLPRAGETADRLRGAFGTSPSLNSINFSVKKEDTSVRVKTANGSTQTVNYTYGNQVMLGNGSTERVNTQQLIVRTANTTQQLPTSPSTYTFEGSGWGHRLGMSQWGARGMAEAGHTYEQILKHYYTGITLGRL